MELVRDGNTFYLEETSEGKYYVVSRAFDPMTDEYPTKEEALSAWAWDLRPCQCGNGEPWANCPAMSTNCG